MSSLLEASQAVRELGNLLEARAIVLEALARKVKLTVDDIAGFDQLDEPMRATIIRLLGARPSAIG